MTAEGATGATSPAIRVHDVTKLYRRYGRKRSVGTLKSALVSGVGTRALAPDDAIPALSGVTFAVTPGESVGVIGANGSGKSTLLKLLSGILRPTSGKCRVRGRLAALLELGAGFHPEISGRENIQITGLLLGLSRREIAERFDAIVRFAEIEDFLEAPVKTYSSGMAVRLGFSIAAHSDPDVLLVDEVLAVGDEAFARRCLEKFSEFERAGKTLLFVSHDLSLVAERCRRALWLDAGKLVADGPAPETVARYREPVAEREGRKRLARPATPEPEPERRVGSGRARADAGPGARRPRRSGRPLPLGRADVPPDGGRGRRAARGLRVRLLALARQRRDRVRLQHRDRRAAGRGVLGSRARRPGDRLAGPRPGSSTRWMRPSTRGTKRPTTTGATCCASR